MLTPSPHEFAELAAQGRRAPVRCRIPADLETPVSAFLKLKPCGATFLLESVEQGIQVGRYSFIGLSPYAAVALQGGRVEIRRDGQIRHAPVDPADPFAPVREELARTEDLSNEPLPAPFGAAVGYLAYDIVRYFENVPLPADNSLDLPDYHFLFPGTLVVFDHVKCEIEILTLPSPGDPAGALAGSTRTIASILTALESPLDLTLAPERISNHPEPSFNMTESAFSQMVARAQEHILDGDAFQVVVAQRLRGRTRTSPFQIYRALRILNPSPYMFYIDFGGYQLIGSSPEALVKLEGRTASVCPIAGTRPRGRTPAEDDALGHELIADEKERAEHVMLVDLGRNDLGRVCEIGSISLDSFMHIERYSHVMHIVSRISGRLRPELDSFDLLRATFPAGTVTGAPKIRAMEIISELEWEARGPYAGAVGYFGRRGDLDLCIAIRTLIVKGDEYIAQAGAGIVADSNPAREYQETLSKIQALTRAITIAERGL